MGILNSFSFKICESCFQLGDLALLFVIHLQEFVDEFCLGHSLSICRDPLELGAKAIGHIVERLFERALSLSLGTAALRVHEAALIILLMAVFIEYNCDINAF